MNRSGKDVRRSPVRFVGFDAVAVRAQNLQVLHFLIPQAHPDPHGVPAMRWLVLLVGVNVVNVEHSHIRVSALCAFSAEAIKNVQLALPITGSALFVALAFSPVPMTAPAFLVAKPSTLWRYRFACWACVAFAKTMLPVAFSATIPCL